MLNLTPYDIVVENENGHRITFEPSGTVASVSTHTSNGDTLSNGISVVERSYAVQCFVLAKGEVKNIPDIPCEPFLVTPAVLDQLSKEYSGIAFAPDPGFGAIRDDKGYIIATSRLITISRERKLK